MPESFEDDIGAVDPNPPAETISPTTDDDAADPEARPRLTRSEQSRINGARSHGPTSTRGKAICSLNALKHGRYAKVTTPICIEDAAAYPEHRYQVADYRQTDQGIEGCGVLYLNKETGRPLWRDSSGTYDGDRNVFNILVELWWASHPVKTKQFNKGN